jgi:hypothetical protein
MSGIRSVRATQVDSAEAAEMLVNGLAGSKARLVIFFAAITHDGGVLGRALMERFPKARVVGCSSNGEFCDAGYGKGGAVAIAIGADRIGACVAEMADTNGDIEMGIRQAAERMSIALGQPLSALSPEKYAGLVLLEGARGREEKINEALGNVAPFLPFVGGSAGDDITFSGTWTFVDGKLEKNGTALVCMEMLVPFGVMKTCHFEATERAVKVTRVDASGRLILELDGKPAAHAYADAIGTSVETLGFPHFLANPLGLMIDGEPWLRSGVRVQGEGILFACAVVEGARLHYMRAKDMVGDTKAKFEQARISMGGSLGGAVFFNCAYRMIEANMTGTNEAYHGLLSTIPHVGLHSNGESYIGHINQTLTGLVFA